MAHLKKHSPLASADHDLLGTNDTVFAQEAGALVAKAFSTTATADNLVERDGSGDVVVPTTPSSGNAATSKTYVDGQVAAVSNNFDFKGSVRVASTAKLDDNTDISGSPTYNDTGGTSTRGQITATLAVSETFAIDGVTLVDNDRVLIKNEGDIGGLGADANGIYVVTITGTALVLDRSTDFDADVEVTAGAFVIIEAGTSNADTGWLLTTNNPIVIGGGSGTNLTFSQFPGNIVLTGGDGIDVAGYTISVDLQAAGSGTGGLEFSTGELKVDPGVGIELTAGGVAVDLEAAGSGTGGLAFNSNEIRINLVSGAAGLELTASGLQVDLEAAGSGTGGLALNGNEIRVDVGTGLELTASGVSVDLEAAGSGTGGLEFNGNEIRVDVGTGLQLTAGGVAVETRIDNVKTSATYAGAAPVYSELNGTLTAVGHFGFFTKAASTTFLAFRKSTGGGDITDFGMVELE